MKILRQLKIVPNFMIIIIYILLHLLLVKKFVCVCLLTLSRYLWASALSLVPLYCGPYDIIKRVTLFVYHLALPHNVGFHLVFQVNSLKQVLDFGDNTITIKDLIINLEDLSHKPHVPKQILDSRTKLLRSIEIRQFKIKWIDKPINDATWERETTKYS